MVAQSEVWCTDFVVNVCVDVQIHHARHRKRGEDAIEASEALRDAVVHPSMREVGLVDLCEVGDDGVDVVRAAVATE